MPLSSAPSTGALPFLDHLRQESARFREVLAEAPAGLRVPTCPDWDADDLLWHLAGVQWFWGEIAERRLTEPEQVDALEASRKERPGDRAALLAAFDRASERLHRSLSALSPDTELWMWAEDHSAAYIARRQAHEALVHRLDAELTAGVDRAPVDCRLAADGVDEVLRIMRGFEDEPGLTDHPVSGPVTIATVDAMHAWTVVPVRVTGTHPDHGELDLLRFRVSDGVADDATAQISGHAADLDAWLWNRPVTGEITRDGDAEALARVDAVLAGSID
ncbi:hypothetical protein N865_17020 [Intrasporangium oryzae NRRL B-24470]|uniref:Mycothiol-dependent maleylpyruvate isomerase metal-binding domain-containing protein n=1 Tax=Intrasporangium oryzae NRRL B-24470 TaxID=1386089 RepID=W9GBH7_9MICO|nr:maleylpyruvate isomerase family mycothiol-dependent enzyme [Intrasporangium oryzae]EWT03430.1 hypothetical protein N865_17020 [Intrasporangium oryzae NRRL B-24470]